MMGNSRLHDVCHPNQLRSIFLCEAATGKGLAPVLPPFYLLIACQTLAKTGLTGFKNFPAVILRRIFVSSN